MSTLEDYLPGGKMTQRIVNQVDVMQKCMIHQGADVSGLLARMGACLADTEGVQGKPWLSLNTDSWWHNRRDELPSVVVTAGPVFFTVPGRDAATHHVCKELSAEEATAFFAENIRKNVWLSEPSSLGGFRLHFLPSRLARLSLTEWTFEASYGGLVDAPHGRDMVRGTISAMHRYTREVYDPILTGEYEGEFWLHLSGFPVKVEM